MAIKVEKLDEGFLIEQKFLLTQDQCNPDYINLMQTKGPDMHYDKEGCFKIDFPGEYDKNGNFIKSYIGEDGLLNYVIRHEDKTFCIIQTPKILESIELDNAKTCLYTNDFTTKVLDKIEFEGESFKLGDENENNDG